MSPHVHINMLIMCCMYVFHIKRWEGGRPSSKRRSNFCMDVRARGAIAILRPPSRELGCPVWALCCVSFIGGWICCFLWLLVPSLDLPHTELWMSLTCSLERFLQGYNSCQFLHLVWRLFAVTFRVVGFLDSFSQVRFSLVCSVVLTDRAEVALAATEWRQGWCLTAWTVPTPPVASYSSADSSSDSTDEL